MFVRLRVYLRVGLRVLLCAHLCVHLRTHLRTHLRAAHFPLARDGWDFLQNPVYGVSNPAKILNKLTDYMKSRAGLDEDHYKHRVPQTYAGMLGDPNYINAFVRKKLNHWVQVLGYPWKWNNFFNVRKMNAKCLVQIAPTLPHGDFQVGELMDQRGTASSSAEVPRCLPSGKKGPRTEAKDETMEVSSTYGWRRVWFWRRWHAGWWR